MAHRLSSEAEIELDDIWLYIATESGSLEVATRFIDKLTQHFYLLSRSPHIGRRRDDDLRPGIRSFPVGNYIVLYRIEEVDVLIQHVVKANRDIERLFGF